MARTIMITIMADIFCFVLGELGLHWGNPELVTDALELGTRGNVIERYKIMKDLQRENYVLPTPLRQSCRTVLCRPQRPLF